MTNPYQTCEAVVLGLDAAKGKTGVMLFVPQYEKRVFIGRHKAVYGCVVKKQLERRGVVQMLVNTARELRLPSVVIAEKHTPGGARMTFDTTYGLGEGWGKWTAEFELAEIDIIARVTPNEWRDALFGKRRPKQRENLKEFACVYSSLLAGRPIDSDDVAEAFCLGLFGMLNPEIRERVDKRRKALAA